VDPAYRDVSVKIVGIPAERFVDHGAVDQLRRLLRLDSVGIAEQIRETLARMKASPRRVYADDSEPTKARSS
jgi:deoxyxylulose-5-phosphate synthase